MESFDVDLHWDFNDISSCRIESLSFYWGSELREMVDNWVEVCRVGKDFQPVSGSVTVVAKAVRRGADLRRFSTYSPRTTGLVEETMTLQTTWIFDDEHVGGLATLRQPVNAATDFEFKPSLAYWIFNVTAPSGIAVVPLNGQPADEARGHWLLIENHPFTEGSDAEWLSTEYRWWVRDDWKEICAHDEQGRMERGSWRDLRQAANEGCVVKAGIRNLWSYLMPGRQTAPEHEVFIECSVQLAHVDGAFFGALTVPTVLVEPCKPLKFVGENFAPGWLLVRTDGRLCRQTLNPVTMRWDRTWTKHAIRWFVR